MTNQYTPQEAILEAFGNKLRVRICGICLNSTRDAVLMVRHHSIGQGKHFWAPPGGGLQYGETTLEALKREFLEETGLQVAVEDFLFVHEFLREPLHGIELFFAVKPIGGVLAKGSDPEMKPDEQIIDQLAFLSFDKIQQQPPGTVHNLFSHCHDIPSLLAMRGLYRFLPGRDPA
jgi:8-oxo-dGTP diphosphatase